MKKIRKIIISLLLTAVIAAGSIVCTHAALPPQRIGDADMDRDVTITDATKIQRWLAGLTEMDKLAQYLGDVDGSGDCSILDATRIQRKLVDLDSFYEDWFYNWYIEDYRFFADYDSGKATVGTPITFTAEVPGYVDHIGTVPDSDGQTESPTHTFEFGFIRSNEEYEWVQERSEINTFTYTFTEPGTYTVVCNIYNWVDQVEQAVIWNYEVVEPYSLNKPVIVSSFFRDDTYNHSGYSPLYVRAEGGSGEYMYKYTIKTHDLLRGWHIEEDNPSGLYTYSNGWTKESVVEMPSPEPDDWWPSWTVTVVARDSEGNLSEPVEVYYYCEDLVG